MDSNLQLPATDNADMKAAFRKPSNDAVNRRYRRHSSVSGSSSDGSPKHGHSSSPIFTREDPTKGSEHRQKGKDDRRELDRDSGRSQYGRSSDSYRHSGRHSSRSSHSYSRHDDYRHDKHVDEEERIYRRTSSHGRESRGGTHSDHTRQESEHSRSKDYSRNVDKYSRDKYDGSNKRSKDKDRGTSSVERLKYKDSPSEKSGSGKRHTDSNFEEDRDRHTRDKNGQDDKRDYHRSSGNKKNDRTDSLEEPRGHRNDSASGWDNSGYSLKEAYKSDLKEMDGEKLTNEEKKKYDDREANRDKDRYSREPGEWFEDKSVSGSGNQESPAKKPKLFSLEKASDSGKDDSKFSPTIANERQSSSSKQSLEAKKQASANGSDAVNDLNAAKVAAMRAAELVNKNLIGGGFMTTDQKKKLLWGNKKSTTADESGNQWDTALFSDRERQEKFNKLMGVKGDVKVDHKPDNQDGSVLLQAEKQKELQLDLEKQYTAGLRRRDGRTVGLGL